MQPRALRHRRPWRPPSPSPSIPARSPQQPARRRSRPRRRRATRARQLRRTRATSRSCRRSSPTSRRRRSRIRRRSPRSRRRSTRRTPTAAQAPLPARAPPRPPRRSRRRSTASATASRMRARRRVSENDPFPDNYLHSDNVELVGHVRGITGGSPSCPAFNPTKCPAYSSLNFVTGYKWLDYDIMVANGTGGLSVWSLKDPAHPRVHLGDPVQPARRRRRAARPGRSSGRART